jgi:hypothetical protein
MQSLSYYRKIGELAFTELLFNARENNVLILLPVERVKVEVCDEPLRLMVALHELFAL